ncbi:MAG: nitroreductase [Anaerocolumna sp.]|jgi:nitroreductase|nr:nitroreductase [Anaerocolumna sp.]
MSQIFALPIDEVVKKRYSVRSYEEKSISKETLQKIEEYMSKLDNPFQVPVKFKLLHTKEASNEKKLGTYGMIKGATDYIGSAIPNVDNNLEALGYAFEKLVLYLTSLGIGTCWLGGTFNRGEFAKALKIEEGELFPAITPIGYAKDNKRLLESFARMAIKADKKKNFEELFFDKDFSKPLTKEMAGIYADPLEFVRLGPSASNKQPWRIVKDGDNIHFYELRNPAYSEKMSYDIQRVDIGIALCHFHLGVLEKNLSGEIKKVDPGIKKPELADYICSWVKSV